MLRHQRLMLWLEWMRSIGWELVLERVRMLINTSVSKLYEIKSQECYHMVMLMESSTCAKALLCGWRESRHGVWLTNERICVIYQFVCCHMLHEHIVADTANFWGDQKVWWNVLERYTQVINPVGKKKSYLWCNLTNICDWNNKWQNPVGKSHS